LRSKTLSIQKYLDINTFPMILLSIFTVNVPEAISNAKTIKYPDLKVSNRETETGRDPAEDLR